MLVCISDDIYRESTIILYDDQLLYKGSAIVLLEYYDNELMINFNYAHHDNYPVKIRRYKDLFITVPAVPFCLFKNYKFKSLVFGKKDFITLIDFGFYETKCINEIKELSVRDAIDIWIYTFDNDQSFTDILEKQRIMLNSILSLSDETIHLDKLIKRILRADSFKPERIKKPFDEVMMYLDTQDEIKEWSALIKVDDDIGLKLNDKYFIRMLQ